MNYFIFLIALISGGPVGKATYIQETRLDGSNFLNGETILLFNSTESIYIHHGIPDQGGVLMEDGNLMGLTGGDKEGFPIYKGRGGLVYKTEVFWKTNCVIHDTIPRIDWQIGQETRQIGKYTCKKAMGIYGGRMYEAWFTPKIPVPHGPYKLGGLPGLILEAHSQDGKVSFHFKSFEWTDKPDRAIAPPTEKIVLSSPSEFPNVQEEVVKKYENKMNVFAEGIGNITIGPAPTDGDRYIEKTNTPK